jgi:hypothetical protein
MTAVLCLLCFVVGYFLPDIIKRLKNDLGKGKKPENQQKQVTDLKNNSLESKNKPS